MKNLYSFAAAILFSAFLHAQTPVELHIDHQLRSDDFMLNDSVMNNLGHPFMFWKLTYYLSDVELIHDGGQVTKVDSTWFLLDITDATTSVLNLGTHAIQSLDSIRFAIGIAEEFNHLDPTLYPTGHPLAPQNPSMHWGWTAGYRFAVAEGWSGFYLDQPFEIHALGDRNFFPQTIATSGTLSNQALQINLLANYAELMRDINLTTTVISHGEVNAAAQLLTNFSLHVFKSPEGNGPVLSIDPLEEDVIALYPNPAATSLRISGIGSKDLVQIYNAIGELICVSMGSKSIEAETWDSGIYFAHVTDEKGVITTLRFIKQ